MSANVLLKLLLFVASGFFLHAELIKKKKKCLTNHSDVGFKHTIINVCTLQIAENCKSSTVVSCKGHPSISGLILNIQILVIVLQYVPIQ